MRAVVDSMQGPFYKRLRNINSSYYIYTLTTKYAHGIIYRRHYTRNLATRISGNQLSLTRAIDNRELVWVYVVANTQFVNRVGFRLTVIRLYASSIIPAFIIYLH